jgi:hypothetical protein
MPTARTAEERAHKAAYARAYRAKNRERLLAIRRAKEAANPERAEERRFRQWLERQAKPELVKRRRQRYAKKHAAAIYAYQKNYRLAHKKDVTLNAQFRRFRIRMEMIAAYGGCCACCGEQTTEFLTLDHIYNDGAAERRATKMPGNQRLIERLRKQGWPKDRYQLLCFNCNCTKGFFGQCPHQRLKALKGA